jgi:hypothetical protein
MSLIALETEFLVFSKPAKRAAAKAQGGAEGETLGQVWTPSSP